LEEAMPSTRHTGIVGVIRKNVVADPNRSVDDILRDLKQSGYANVSTNTVISVRNTTRQVLVAMRDAGWQTSR
jgi:hypothetical protein